MQIKNFEDLDIWQEARHLSKVVFSFTLNEIFVNDYRFRDQMRSSSGSVMDNIAEGFGRSGNGELKYFLYVSKGSCLETRSQAYRAFDYGYITETQLNELLQLTDKLSAKIQKLIQHLKKTTFKGPKYK